MKQGINNIAEENMEIGKVCYLAALTNIFSCGGTDITEDELLISTSALSLKTEYIQGEFQFRCADLDDDYEMYRTEIKKLGWEIYYKGNLSSEELDSFFSSNVSSKEPIVIVADVYYLPYHTYYHQVHECHIVEVIERKEGKMLLKDFLVIGINQKCFVGWIDYDSDMFDLSKATENVTNLFWKFRKIESIDKVDLDYMRLKLINTASEILIGEYISQINDLKEYYKEIYENSDKELAKKQLISLDKMIALSGGPSPVRGLIGDFFARNKEFENSVLAENYYELSRLWRIIAKLSIKASISFKEATLVKICSRLDEINELERKCATEILEYY